MEKLNELENELVTTGNPTEGGCCWTNFEDAAEPPTSASQKLEAADGWESLGELSENGFTESRSVETTEHKGWHGTVLLVTPTSEKNTFKAEFTETARPAVAKLRYGAGNVDVNDEGTVEHVAAKAMGAVAVVPLVFDELESGGFLRRTVVPKAAITSFDDVPHRKGDLLLYGMTFTAVADGDKPAFDIYRARAAHEGGQEPAQPEGGATSGEPDPAEPGTFDPAGDVPPTEANTVAEIEAWAQAHGVDLAGCSTKAEKLARIAGGTEA